MDAVVVGRETHGAGGDDGIRLRVDAVVGRRRRHGAAGDPYVALRLVVGLIALQGVAPGAEGERAVLHDERVLAPQRIVGGGHGDRPADHREIVGGRDAVVARIGDRQRPRARHGQIGVGGNRGARLGIRRARTRHRVGRPGRDIDRDVIGRDDMDAGTRTVRDRRPVEHEHDERVIGRRDHDLAVEVSAQPIHPGGADGHGAAVHAHSRGVGRCRRPAQRDVRGVVEAPLVVAHDGAVGVRREQLGRGGGDVGVDARLVGGCLSDGRGGG